MNSTNNMHYDLFLYFFFLYHGCSPEVKQEQSRLGDQGYLGQVPNTVHDLSNQNMHRHDHISTEALKPSVRILTIFMGA